MQLPQDFDTLVAEAHTWKLYQKLIQQLNKDLTFANIDLGFDASVLPSSLKLVLQEKLHNLITERFTEYLNLLYIVDVSEHKVRTQEVENTYELAERITFLILQREWQKVWFKHQNS